MIRCLDQGAETNRKEIRGLCEEVAALAQALEGLAQMIQDGLDKYASDSPKRQTQEDVFGVSELGERIARLQRYVVCRS